MFGQVVLSAAGVIFTCLEISLSNLEALLTKPDSLNSSGIIRVFGSKNVLKFKKLPTSIVPYSLVKNERSVRLICSCLYA